MIPRFVDAWLDRDQGALGSHYAAFKEWRWGDPHVRIIDLLCDRSKLSVDVGAHLGDYTYFMRRVSRACLAFEPNPALAAHLRRRFPTRVTVREASVSDRPGRAVLRIPRDGLGLATIEPANAVSGDEEVDVEIVTLDEAVTEDVAFLKVDVEGHEMSVFHGAEGVLKRCRPNIIVELENRHRPGIVDEAFAYFAALGYRGWFLHRGTVLPIERFDAETHQNFSVSKPYVANFIFSPRPDLARGLQRGCAEGPA
ncbi:FkbM family methyltransferase [Elioraea rosea]|uniref:FkbM family methyltransferase n=1 Tax=Elioraea rosea TaxID=2492390 RepID=UPI00118442E4|nr:FkbM family methyltransferase [Elioraea rosea]